MNLVQVDPDEKYVLVMPDATAAQTERIIVSLRGFIEDDVHVIFGIHGTDVTIIPADQVVGYKVLAND